MILARLIPLAAFIGLGIFLRVRSLVGAQAVEQLKWLIVHVLLPGVLFKTLLLARLAPGLALTAAGAWLVGDFLIGRLLGWAAGYRAAAWLLFLTAPSFSVPVFAPPRTEAEQAYISSTIVTCTGFTFVAEPVRFSLFPTL